MKRIVISIFLASAAFAGKQSDDVARKIFDALKAEKSGDATRAISDSASPLLKEKIDQKGNFEQFSSQFDVLIRTFGKPVMLETVLNKKVGKFEKTGYLMYTPMNAIHVEIIEYAAPGSTSKIIHFRVDDKAPDWF